jgi:hypothetical protein
LNLKSCSTDPWEDDDNDGIKNLVDSDWRGQSYGDLNFTLISPFGLALPVECSLMGLDFIPTLASPLAIWSFFFIYGGTGTHLRRANSKPNSSVCNIYHQQG